MRMISVLKSLCLYPLWPVTVRRFVERLYRSYKDLVLFMRDSRAVRPGVSKETGGLLIVRVDAIGDYMLFRQCLNALRSAPRFRGKKITLCGNAVWRQLAETLDRDAFDEFIPVERQRFKADAAYRHQLLRTVRDREFEYALQPTFSREYMGDCLVHAAHAPERVGFACPLQNITAVHRCLFNRRYSTLIQAAAGYPFELFRNAEVAAFLGVPAEALPPFRCGFPNHATEEHLSDEVRRCLGNPVFFIGASSERRCWPESYWAEVAPFVSELCGKKIVLGGGEAFSDPMKRIVELCREGLVMALPNTSLVEMAALIAAAPLVLCTDSSGAHIAATFDVPFVIISNGSIHGRFHPYPEELGLRHRTVYPEGFPTGTHAYYYEVSPYTMSDVPPDAVRRAVLSVLQATVPPVSLLKRS